MSAAGDERLRQEREAFNLNKGQSIGWFWVQMITAITVLLILVGVGALCGFVVLHPERFDNTAMGIAVAGLLAELASVITIYVRAVMSPAHRTALMPVTSAVRPKD